MTAGADGSLAMAVEKKLVVANGMWCVVVVQAAPPGAQRTTNNTHTVGQ